ncbi:MAG TPA: DUF3303 family protein [Nitrososphaeraceae archaeon]|jgi:hypothetical protein|nr:DUF3303 family protein [Nitrososphaeraceae archaeon]
MGLYGIYGNHSAESCPLYNTENRDLIIKMNEQLKEIANKNNIKILQQYHSALEHTFIWVVDAKEAHSVQNFMIDSGWAKFNAVKIVPLGSYEHLIEACKGLRRE